MELKTSKSKEEEKISSIESLVKELQQSSDITDDINDIHLGKKKPEIKGLFVTPSVGFSMKTKNLEDSSKVFINFTTHESIEKPSMKKKLDENGQEIEGMNVPMSVGPGRPDVDKSNVPCNVYDIIVHPDVMLDCDNDPTGKFREFLIQVGMQCLGQKYKLRLDQRYKIPNLKYKGSEIPQQHIQDRKNMPKIEEVSGAKASSKPSIQKKNSLNNTSDSKTIVQEIPEEKLTFKFHYFNSSVNYSHDNDLIIDIISNINEHPFPPSIILSDINTNEYIEPIQKIHEDSKAIIFTSDIQLYDTNQPNVKLNVSAYKFNVKIPGYILSSQFLPNVIKPNYTFYHILPLEGFISRKKLCIVMLLDLEPLEREPDIGSKPWLLSQALSDDRTSNISKQAIKEEEEGISNNDISQIKHFHINQESLDDVDLPEDIFHRKDAGSSFIIQQRESSRLDKIKKMEEDRKVAEADPNIEFIDAASNYNSMISGNSDQKINLLKLNTAETQKSLKINLKSDLWTELLD